MTAPADQKQIWYALDLDVEANAHEAVEYGLMEAGALGTETAEAVDTNGMVKVSGYFPALPQREFVREQLAEALRIYELPSSSIRELSFREVPNQDWLNEWKKNWQPVEIGRLVVAPPWGNIQAARDRVVIRIEPGMAFGTGTHETTRLCLKAILRCFKGGSFLDVGTGTGVLAIAAAKLFPDATITACDTDPLAVGIAVENARLNDVGERIDFRIGSLAEAPASADFVCANLTADVIGAMLDDLIAASCGRLVLSGILESQLDSIVERLPGSEESGDLIVMRDGEWVAIVL
jgi:ribosomal protein L11 methyltransferase